VVGPSPVLTYNEPGIAAAFWSVPSPSRLVFGFGFVFGFVKSFLFGSLRGTEIGTIMHVKKRQTPNYDVCEGKARQGRRVGHFTHEPSAVTHVIVGLSTLVQRPYHVFDWHGLPRSLFLEVGVRQIPARFETLSIVCHVGIHVDASFMIVSLGIKGFHV